MKYRLWLGDYDNDLHLSKDFFKSFLSCKNDNPVPSEAFEVAKKKISNYYEELRKVAIEVAEKEVEKELKREDRYVVMLLKALDELIESINILEEKYRDLVEIKNSGVVESLNRSINDLKKLRKEIEKEIEDIMLKIAPNLSEVAGVKLGARLIEKAGSLEKLATLPASTIQVIGAEKSLFKAISRMKKGKKARVPKHGIIFQHPFIRTLPKRKRGKMARFLASKIAIAARVDYFSGELKEDMIEEVRHRYERIARS